MSSPRRAGLREGDHVVVRSPSSSWRGAVGVVARRAERDGGRVAVDVGGRVRYFLPGSLVATTEATSTAAAKFHVGQYVAVAWEEADSSGTLRSYLGDVRAINVCRGGFTYSVHYEPHEEWPEGVTEEEVSEARIKAVPATIAPAPAAARAAAESTSSSAVLKRRYGMSARGAKLALLVADVSPGSGLADVDKECRDVMMDALADVGFECTTLESPAPRRIQQWLQALRRPGRSIGCVFIYFASHGDEHDIYTSCDPAGCVRPSHRVNLQDDVLLPLRHAALLGVPKVVFVDTCAGGMELEGVRVAAAGKVGRAAVTDAALRAAHEAAAAEAAAAVVADVVDTMGAEGDSVSQLLTRLQARAAAAQARAGKAARKAHIKGGKQEEGLGDIVPVGADEVVVRVTVPGYVAVTSDITSFFAEQLRFKSRSVTDIMRAVAQRAFAVAPAGASPQLPCVRSTLRYELLLHL